MTSARVLLVEDDPALRRFVALALDELDIELVQCASVAAAVGVLTLGPVDLILTDLMMPGESGLGLLQRLQQSPQLRGAARVVVLSAGLSGAVREQLAAMGVWRMLAKPVAVAALESCVREGLAGGAGSGPTAPARLQEPGYAGASAPDSDTEQAIRTYFEGDVELFQAYRQACLEQFPRDIEEGDLASASADLQSLRRVAHSLKSVLQTLGHPSASALARELEGTSDAGVLEPAQSQWASLRTQLSLLLRDG